jgi:hypothetical protein
LVVTGGDQRHYVRLFPQEYRPVRVRLTDGRWVDGWLQAYDDAVNGWTGYVRYSTGLRATSIDWFLEDAIEGGRST